MTEVAERQELIEAPAQETALEVFKAEKGLDPYLATVREQVEAFLANPPSLETRAGRQAYASMAHKVARSKTAVDAVGKELVAELKKLPGTVDAERKRWRDTLDAWRDEVRGPLNEWEEKEEARKAVHEGAIQGLKDAALGLDELDSEVLSFRLGDAERVTVDQSWEEYEAEAHRVKEVTVSTLRAALTKQQARETEQAELARLRAEQEAREQQEREERIAREATERATREAREAAERREREHQEALARTQREAKEARERYEREAREKAERHELEQRREREEAQRRQSDKDHRASVNRAALQAMLENGMPEECAKQAITLIAKGQVPHITINY